MVHRRSRHLRSQLVDLLKIYSWIISKCSNNKIYQMDININRKKKNLPINSPRVYKINTTWMNRIISNNKIFIKTILPRTAYLLILHYHKAITSSKIIWAAQMKVLKVKMFQKTAGIIFRNHYLTWKKS